MYNIQKAKQDDLKGVASLARECPDELGFVSNNELQRGIDKGTLHIIRYAGRLLGYALYNARRDGQNVIYSIAVRRAYRGLGIGQKLFYSVPAPVRLKVTGDNHHAIKFYEHLGMKQVARHQGRKRELLEYAMSVHFIQCAGNNRTFYDVANEAGVAYGSRHNNAVRGEAVMIDIDWQKYDWDDYLGVIKKYRPVMAMVADYENPLQKPVMLEQVADLRQLGVLRIMACPKFEGALDDIPQDCVIALSLPSKASVKYGGYIPKDIHKIDGRQVHFLGGSPVTQKAWMPRIHALGAKVISCDGNSHQRAGMMGRVFTSYWQWADSRLTMNNKKMGMLMTESARNWRDMLNATAQYKQMPLI